MAMKTYEKQIKEHFDFLCRLGCGKILVQIDRKSYSTKKNVHCSWADIYGGLRRGMMHQGTKISWRSVLYILLYLTCIIYHDCMIYYILLIDYIEGWSMKRILVNTICFKMFSKQKTYQSYGMSQIYKFILNWKSKIILPQDRF